MAKKSTKKTTVEASEAAPIEMTNTEVNIETIMEDASKNIPEEINVIKEELENVKPSDELMKSIIAEPENAETILNEKLEELNNIEAMVQKEIQKVVNNNPSIKKNRNFTYMWNGVNLYE
jgi:DNA gyrase/topoisomerase IV subunit A